MHVLLMLLLLILMASKRLYLMVWLFLINGKLTGINRLGKLRNLPSWLVILLVVSFNKVPLFLKDLTIFKISFVSLFVSISVEALVNETPFYFLLKVLSPVSIRKKLFNFSEYVFFNFFHMNLILSLLLNLSN